MKSNTTIDPEEYYTPTTIFKNGWFPWIKSVMTILAMMREKKASKIYKPITRKAGKQTRYYIKGSTIMEVIELAEKGELQI